MSLFEQVQQQIRKSYTYIQDSYPEELLAQVLTHKNIIDTQITLKKDDGSVSNYQAYRCQHVDVRGPFKWGIRFHPNVSLDEVKSLSAWMSIKTAVVDLPLWGGKWGIVIDPKGLSTSELERLSRAYIQAIRQDIWPSKDVPAPDVNTNGTIMGWMTDEYAKLTGSWQPGVITGKPLTIGGSKGRSTATSLGGLQSLNKYLEHQHDTIQNKVIVVQGAGNVGLNFAVLAAQAWARIVAISDSHGAIYNPNWLDISQIVSIKDANRSVSEYTDAQQITNEQLLSLPCDILVPAALENQITADNASSLQCKLVLELANGPTTAEADALLSHRGIIVLPDILANAGGVTVSYFEQVQNNTNYYWEEAEVQEKLEKIMYRSTSWVIATAEKYQIPLRDAAYVIALERILGAMRDRGR